MERGREGEREGGRERLRDRMEQRHARKVWLLVLVPEQKPR